MFWDRMFPTRAKCSKRWHGRGAMNISISTLKAGPWRVQDQASSIAKYQKTLSAFRKADPSVKLGLYGCLADQGSTGGQSAIEGGRRTGRLETPKYQDRVLPRPSCRCAISPPCIHFTGIRTLGWPMRNPISGKHAGFHKESRSTASCGRSFIKLSAFLPGNLWYAQLDTCRRLACQQIVIWGTISQTIRPIGQ